MNNSSTPFAIWITWEHQRRSRELAYALGVPLVEIDGGRQPLLRCLRCAWRTLSVLRLRRPGLVFVQNPSVFLAAMVCALRPSFGYRVVVDRHSNFNFADTHTGLINRIGHYTLKRADLTIVTNEGVASIVREHGGRPFILPDPLPRLEPAGRVRLRGTQNVVFVSSFARDEPIAEVLEAARLLGPEVCIYITGNDGRMDPGLRCRVPENVTLTGFLPDRDYDSLIATANVLLALTTREHTLLCGAYEALSAGTPLIISNHAALVRYFGRGAVVTDNRATAIADAIRTALARENALRAQIVGLRDELRASWSRDFMAMIQELGLPAAVCAP